MTPDSAMLDQPEALALVMRIILQRYPQFMDRMKDQTGVTLRQALNHSPRTEKLGTEFEAVHASLGQ